MEKHEILQKCKVEGNLVKLPDIQLDRKLYLEVSKALNLIGGIWRGGKVGGFVFQTDPTDSLYQISIGQQVSIKKKWNFNVG